MQLYLDQFFTAEVGGPVNDQTALLFAGETTPEDAAAAITAIGGRLTDVPPCGWEAAAAAPPDRSHVTATTPPTPPAAPARRRAVGADAAGR